VRSNLLYLFLQRYSFKCPYESCKYRKMQRGESRNSISFCVGTS